MPGYPHLVCPDHGDQVVTGISGDLLEVYLACGAVVTGTIESPTVTHPEGAKS